MPFEPSAARAYAALAQAAYCAPSGGLLNWTCAPCLRAGIRVVPGSVRFIERDELGKPNATFIYIARVDTLIPADDGCVVAVRGSKNIANWIRDFEFWQQPVLFEGCPGCMVEAGFDTIWRNVQAEVVQGLTDIGCAAGAATNSLYITGHSLGSAVSNVAMFMLERLGYKVQRSYNFESPRVGNPTYAATFHDRFARFIPVFRITHSMDPVPHLPPEWLGYRHVVQEVFYDSSGNYKVCSGEEDPTCAGQYSLVETLLHSQDHCASPLVPNGNICRCDVDGGEAQDSVIVV